jgi:GNAT superfamily N-acetyltransferase
VARVVEIPPEATHELRRRVLRGADPAAEVRFEEDGRPGAFHLGVVEGAGPDGLVAVGTFVPEATPHRPRAVAVRVRGMAVEPARQGEGLGSLLLDAAVARLRARGVAVVWGNARDTALAFYLRHGFQVAGEGVVTIGLPHHVVVLDLAPGPG